MKLENKIEIFKIPDFVTCKICMNEYEKINNSHLKKHGLTPKLYLIKYPGSILTCASTLRKQGEKRRIYLKNHPEIKPPKSRLKEFSKNKEFIEKKILHSTLVVNLPYRKKQSSKQCIERWNDSIFREKRKKEQSKLAIVMWKNKELREKMQKAFLERRKKRIAEYMPRIQRLLKQGYSIEKIAEKIGYSYQTIYNWLNVIG